MAIGLNRDELVHLFNERSETFKKQMLKRVEGWTAPLQIQTQAPLGGLINLGEIPEFKAWLADVAMESSFHGIDAFIDTVTMDAPEISELESLRKDKEALQQCLNYAYSYIKELGGTIHPIEWPEYESYGDDDTLPWSTSPH